MNKIFTKTIYLAPIPIVQLIAVMTLFGLSIFFNFGYLSVKHSEAACTGKYKYVNMRFACFDHHVVDKRDYTDLKHVLTEYIDAEKSKGNVDVVSVFFRDLESGPTMGIDERIDYIPASLLKLPNALVLMRLSEEGEINLGKEQMTYSKEDEEKEKSIRTQYDIVPGTYTLNELIAHALTNSDNSANRLLLKYIAAIDHGRNLQFEIYRDLGILEVTDTVSSAVNAKGYSSIFRMLYNSSFLNSDSSEQLLSLMANSLDVGGLRDGVPEGVRISHKFGERSSDVNNRQLHDCGIVYYPHNPYLLCVMTKGKDLQALKNIIAHISKEVYEEFDSRSVAS